MNLENDTNLALDLTLRLKAALEMDDLEIARDLLELRGEAMSSFEASHRAATQEIRQSAFPLIRQLQTEDQQVRQRLAEILAENGQRLRESIGSASGPGQQAYNTTSPPSCLDRRA